MTKKLVAIIFTVGIMFSSCNFKNKATGKILYISAETRNCQAGVMEKECMLIKWGKDQKDWENFYDNIEGFTYEKGNEYELVVAETKVENPPADGSSIKYKLVKIVSKNKTATVTVEK